HPLRIGGAAASGFAPPAHVGELEPDHFDPRGGDARGDRLHERRIHRRAGAVCKHQRIARGPGAVDKKLRHDSAALQLFFGSVTSRNARIASTAVGTPLYCERWKISSLISEGLIPRFSAPRIWMRSSG